MSRGQPRVLYAGPRDDSAEQVALRKLAEVIYIPRDATDSTTQAEHIRHSVQEHGEGFVAYADYYQTGHWFHNFGPKLFESIASSCRCYVSIGVGVDTHDMEWMTAQGAWLCNSPRTNQRITADGTVAHILLAFRGLKQMDATARQGKWQDYSIQPIDWRGRTLGILGMGEVGKRVADTCHALGMKIVYHNRNRRIDLPEEYKYLPAEEFWGSFDCLSINCPKTPETDHLVNRETLSKMKDGVMIVNTARGNVIDESALIGALESGKVRRSGLDVFEAEPEISIELRENAKVTVTPHMMFHADTFADGMNAEIIRNIIAFLETGRPLTPVNYIQ